MTVEYLRGTSVWSASSSASYSGHRTDDGRSVTARYICFRTVPATSTTLGRLSKSTGRLLADDYSGNVSSDRAQTLPRKLKTEGKVKKQVNVFYDFRSAFVNDFGPENAFTFSKDVSQVRTCNTRHPSR